MLCQHLIFVILTKIIFHYTKVTARYDNFGLTQDYPTNFKQIYIIKSIYEYSLYNL